MNLFNITLSHSDELETLRMHRLQRVVHMLLAAHTATDYFEDAPQITKLHDHEGNLEVYWAAKPEEQHKFCVNMIWEMMNELAMNVRHGYPGVSKAEAFQLTYSEELI